MLRRISRAALVLALALGPQAPIAHADQAPAPVSQAEQAEKAILQLNANMFTVYDAALGKFKEDFLGKHPVILALFSGTGGKLILYRPDQPPVEAPQVAKIYQLVKSVGHTGLGLYEIVWPYVKNPKADQGWREPMSHMRASIAKALAGVDDLAVSASDRDVIRAMLQIDLDFADKVLKAGTYTEKDVVGFARSLKPYIKKIGAIAAGAQANHWVDVLAQWKKDLGPAWDRTYAVSNTIYVTRQNNILFSILAQFMGVEAINRRLLLFETTSFTTTPDDMLDLLTRVLSDRELGKTFFNDYMLMDTELFGSAAREALRGAMLRIGQTPVFPEYARFDSNEWPWRTNPAYGQGPRTMEETTD